MIGRTDALKVPGAVKPTEQTLLPNLPRYHGDARAQVKQNLGQLRDYVTRSGYKPIRDAGEARLGARTAEDGSRGGEYLELERRELERLGYKRHGDFWVHPRGATP